MLFFNGYYCCIDCWQVWAKLWFCDWTTDNFTLWLNYICCSVIEVYKTLFFYYLLLITMDSPEGDNVRGGSILAFKYNNVSSRCGIHMYQCYKVCHREKQWVIPILYPCERYCSTMISRFPKDHCDQNKVVLRQDYNPWWKDNNMLWMFEPIIDWVRTWM